MAQESFDLVRRLYDAAARRDAEAVLSFYDLAVEWDFGDHPFGVFMGRRIYRGHDGLRSWFREFAEAWEEHDDILEELIDAGEHVVSVVTTRVRGRTSGADVQITRHAAVWTVRGGKVTRVVWVPTRERALEVAGGSA